MLDGLFSLSFLLRGKVSAATAAAAELDYNDIFIEDRKYTYYGRVTRQNGWTILQYWFFFCFNSWRSGFHGVNDHESDWEMVTIYLYEQDGQLIPEWAAYASHDFKGDDLRRRWDDHEELKIMEQKPSGDFCRSRFSCLLFPARRIPGGSQPASAGLVFGPDPRLEQVVDRDTGPAGD